MTTFVNRKSLVCLWFFLFVSSSCIQDEDFLLHTVEVTITQDNPSRARFWLGIDGELDYGWHDRHEVRSLKTGDSIKIHFMSYAPHLVKITIRIDNKIIHQAYHGETIMPIEWEYGF